ncbi:YfbM family protein [Streptomyces fragilis]|uniref:YfbM family protein n=1 Tax=Streptomyces fragilis TaxID=67301 RepID=A0ABV2YJZ8_9ACTN|nr:YfbM family protein [Streptomyces fragilis]
MSMIGEYARLSPAELERAVREPRWAPKLVDAPLAGEPDAGPGSRRHDVDKTWQALGFLLDRAGFPVDVTFGDEVLPGADDWGYGPPRLIRPERVRVAAEAFGRIPPASLAEGVGPSDLAAADVYPRVVWERGEPLDWVTGHYEALGAFFRAAARAGDAVLVWID